MERTLLIIKPDGVKKRLIGEILRRVEGIGLTIKAMRMLQLDRRTTGRFYLIHRGKNFYHSLIEFMTSGPVVVVGLEGSNAVKRLRDLNGDTDPDKAAEGTIRRLYADNIERNTVHGSDSTENGKIETSFFFGISELEMSGEIEIKEVVD